MCHGFLFGGAVPTPRPSPPNAGVMGPSLVSP